ncbi:hypothetical protein SSBR45G_34600 [Bradyrhizobium sp. SSBR45G]|uniref:hypothetical protein n=1 Tax=unclassified Bradyrhizobium TaxID=2631580 RepID=UPI002342A30A|nr:MULTISPECIES: hypothetical protein [unclassified Bradyrhizobium]GLH78551.1 hypothetical protein SSBR45G_34600 [Bradyrhizobium sp. SSBR45G]GLH86335.1 hypothetical protein SSBR45R_37950 [Bradyrhizobium sp. SSBR45R]
MPRLPSLFSFWALIAFAALGLLQLFPLTGIMLMLLGGALWCGLAVHAFLIGLGVEAALGRVPRILLVVPLAAYAAYYMTYLQETRDIRDKAEQIRASNPSRALPFDPARYSLVLPTNSAQTIAGRYDVPVTYDANPNFQPEGFLSHRLLARQQCSDASAAQARLRAQGSRAAFGLVLPLRVDDNALVATFIKNVCLLNFPEKPPLQPIVVTRRGDDTVWRRDRGILEQTTEFSLDGKVFATYRTASVWRLSPVPLLLIGCALNSGAPSWDCFANFNRTLETVDTTPANVDKMLYDLPESIVLGLRKHLASDYADDKGDDQWQPLLQRIDDYQQRQTQFDRDHNADLFAQFVDFVHDSAVETSGTGVFINIVYKGSIAPPGNMEHAVLAAPEKLAPLRDAIVERFIQLTGSSIGVNNKWYRLLDKSLVALPREAYASMTDDQVNRLLEALGASRGWDYFRELYLRMTDAGLRTEPFFERELAKLQNRGASKSLVPELAICRLGQADEHTREILRKAFADTSNTDQFDDPVEHNSAVFVTLLRLGDAAAAHGAPASFTREDVVSWYDAVRQGKGRTDVGPNNCNGWGRSGFRDMNWWRRFPQPLRASLVYQDKAWVEAKAN